MARAAKCERCAKGKGEHEVLYMGPRGYRRYQLCEKCESEVHLTTKGAKNMKVKAEGEIKVPDDELDPQKAIGFDEEMDFLTFLELGWIEPSERRAKWAR